MHTDAPPYPRRWQALVVLALSLFVVTVGNTILNVALPTIRAELDAGSSQLQWIVDALPARLRRPAVDRRQPRRPLRPPPSAGHRPRRLRDRFSARRAVGPATELIARAR